MQSPKVSVIVPVYKVEKYLRRCVDSILAQTFADFELLLIDDGSPDNSGKICDEYAALDPRVRVFHKPNGGVSSARNLGLDKARGEWIVFVDSDDWLQPECLSALHEEENTDLVVCSHRIWNNERDSRNVVFKNQEYSNLKEFLEENILSMTAPWGKAFKKSLIDKQCIRFNTDLSYGEDRQFIYDYLKYIDSAKTLDSLGYNYVVGIPDSLSQNKPKEDKLLDLFKGFYVQLLSIGKIRGINLDRIAYISFESDLFHLLYILYSSNILSYNGFKKLFADDDIRLFVTNYRFAQTKYKKLISMLLAFNLKYFAYTLYRYRMRGND